MCGRYSYFGPLSNLQKDIPFNIRGKEPTAHYNIAPTQHVPVIYRDMGQTILEHFHWGLIPFWAKEPSIGSRLINARVETLAEKPAFRGALKNRRCLIPANGYFEWTGTKGNKQPFFISTASEGPFAFAGLWESWGEKVEAQTIRSCTIITTEASAEISHLHSRMPVILPPCAYENWLNPGGEDTQKLLGSIRTDCVKNFVFHPVSKNVNSVFNNTPDIVREINV